MNRIFFTCSILYFCLLNISCKKRDKVELVGKASEYIGVWECTGRNRSSGRLIKPYEEGFEHDLIFTIDGCYDLIRADGVIESGKIVSIVDRDGSTMTYTFLPIEIDQKLIISAGGKNIVNFSGMGLLIDLGANNYSYHYLKK